MGEIHIYMILKETNVMSIKLICDVYHQAVLIYNGY